MNSIGKIYFVICNVDTYKFTSSLAVMWVITTDGKKEVSGGNKEILTWIKD